MLEKNNTIYLWKILFTYAIVIYHYVNAYEIVTGWYICVEFFFLVSGFLIAKKFLLDKCEYSPIEYTVKRALHFIPIYFLVAIAALIVTGITSKQSVLAFLNDVFMNIPDFLLIFIYGKGRTVTNVVWYVNVLLAGGLIISYFLQYNKNLYLNIIAPFSVLIIYNWFCYYGGNIAIAPYDGVIYPWFLRGFAGLSYGVLLFLVSKYVMGLKKNRIMNNILNVIELLIYISFLYATYYHGFDSKDTIYMIFLGIAVVLSFTHKVSLKMTENHIMKLFNNISLFLYLSHVCVLSFFVSSVQGGGMMITYVIVSTTVAFLLYIFYTACHSLFKAQMKKNSI